MTSGIPDLSPLNTWLVAAFDLDLQCPALPTLLSAVAYVRAGSHTEASAPGSAQLIINEGQAERVVNT